ncbi:MAG: hypothetical protein LBT46_00565 [Planctomycetaceae bacterium]|jgi:hypothetical protein|nr:hypothetical protein [Planctomycetaceae bacterium]
MKITDSQELALFELIASVKKGEEVFLLKSSDALAENLFQDYNDGAFDDENIPEEYRCYLDTLARSFDSRNTKPGKYVFPNKEERDKMRRLLAGLAEKF